MSYRYIQIGILLLFSISVMPAVAGEVSEFRLNNGLKLIIKEDHRAPVVVSQVWYKVGSSYETEGRTGLSHMLEHMMFKGTQKYGSNEFSQIMAANGASENAFTSTDYTAFFQTIAKDRLALSFELEADRMHNLVLNQDEFTKERQVVLEERRSRTDDDANSALYEIFMATAFQTSSYRNPIIGWKNDIEQYELADLQTWYHQWYGPNNATLVVVGDVEPNEVFKLAQQYFDTVPTIKVPSSKSRIEIPQVGTKRVTVRLPAKLPYLVMGYKVPSLKTVSPEREWEVYALEILSELLSGSDSARFSKYLERGQQIATVAYASYSLYDRLETLFEISGIPAEQHTTEELETQLRDQISQLQTTQVSLEELNRVKIQLRASKTYELDSMFYQGMKIGMLESIGLDWHSIDDYLTKIDAITSEQLQTIANKYFIDDHLTIAVLDPQPITGQQTTQNLHHEEGGIH